MTPAIATLVAAGALLMPVAGPITRGHSAGHPAIDIACLPGAPVVASHAGTLSYSRSHTHGLTATVVAADGTRSSYSHLDSSSGATEGPVEQGAVIGACGSSGRWSSGPHVHWEIDVPV